MVRRLSLLAGIATAIAATSTLAAQDTTVSRRDLVDGGWHLAGMIFAMMPAGGFAITFRDDGTVLSSNLREASTWSLANGVLRLHDSSGGVVHRFDWWPRARVFRECSRSNLPPLVIFQNESRSSDILSVGCGSASEPLRTFGVSCRLEVVPARIRRGEVVEFHYVLSSPDSQRVSGRILHLDEETFGHSIRLRSDSGAEYRFLRTLLFSYVVLAQPDTGEVTPRTYRFRFPTDYRSDFARLVSSRDWNRVWSFRDSASYERQRVFAAGATSIPPGEYDVSAELSYHIFWTADRGRNGIAPMSDALPCTPARLVVSP